MKDKVSWAVPCSGYTEPRRFTSRMLKKSASGVLASLRGSTYRSVRLTPSLAAVLLDSLFEYPAWCTPVAIDVQAIEYPPCHNSFSADC